MTKKIEIADGSIIAYKLTGDLSKPVIVLVNGSIFNYKQFDPVIIDVFTEFSYDFEEIHYQHKDIDPFQLSSPNREKIG